MKLRKAILYPISLCSISIASAQVNNKDTLLPTQRIDIIQEYTPEVKLPAKPVVIPTPLSLDQKFPTPNIPIIDNKDVMTFGLVPIKIKPLALQVSDITNPYHNYLAIGLGNYRTLHADLGLTYHKMGKYDASVHAYHLSQRGGASFPDRSTSLTDVSVSGKYIFPKVAIIGRVGVEHKTMTQYGYNHELFKLDRDDILLRYTTISLNAALADELYHNRGFKVKPAVETYLMNSRAGQHESYLRLALPFQYAFSNVTSFNLGVNTVLSSLLYKNNNIGNSYLQLSPHFTFVKEKLYAKLGASGVWLDKAGLKLMPDVAFRYAFGDDAKVAVNMGFVGDVMSYSLRQMAYKNPFAVIDSVSNARHQRAYVGMEIALLKNVKAEFKATYHQLDHYAIFVNDYADSIGNNFNVNHLSKFNYFSLYGGAQIMVTDRFLLGMNGDINIWGDNADGVYHEPTLKIGFEAKSKPIEELQIALHADVWNGMRYLDNIGNSRSLDPIFNLGLSGEYNFYKRYAAFLTLNNIANSNNAMWHQYPSYEFNIFGGIKVKF